MIHTSVNTHTHPHRDIHINAGANVHMHLYIYAITRNHTISTSAHIYTHTPLRYTLPCINSAKTTMRAFTLIPMIYVRMHLRYTSCCVSICSCILSYYRSFALDNDVLKSSTSGHADAEGLTDFDFVLVYYAKQVTPAGMAWVSSVAT